MPRQSPALLLFAVSPLSPPPPSPQLLSSQYFALVATFVLIVALTYAPDLLYVLELFVVVTRAFSEWSSTGQSEHASTVATTTVITVEMSAPVSEFDACVSLAWAVVGWGKERDRHRSSAWLYDPDASDRREWSVQARHRRRHQRRHQSLQTALEKELPSLSARFTSGHKMFQSYPVLETDLLLEIKGFDRTSQLRTHAPVRLSLEIDGVPCSRISCVYFVGALC